MVWSVAWERTAPEVHDRALLCEEDVLAFRRQGFVIVPSLTTPEDIALIRETLLGLYARFAELPRRQAVDLGTRAVSTVPQIPEINWTIGLAPVLRHTLAFSRCAAVAGRLLGRAAVHTGFDHAILKPPANACATPWHQDEAYVDPRCAHETVHFWIPLQDVSLEMGCMQFIPGSHRGPLRPHRRRGGSAEAHALEAEGVDPSLAVACPVASGGATAHLPRTLHYTGPNLTDEPRLAWILEFGVAPGRWRTLRHTLGRLARPAGPRAAPRPPSA
jgi:hypothetical protein